MSIVITPKPGVDRTAEIQALINSAKNATMAFTSGEYILGSLKVNPSQIARFLGPKPTHAPAVLKTKPKASKFNRIFSVNWGRAGLTSPIITFGGLTFDLNKDNQGWLGGYDLEQQAAIFASSTTGDLQIKVTGCAFKNGVAGAITIHNNTISELRDCIATDIFRGAIMINSKRCTALINNFKCYSKTLVTGLDLEPTVDNAVVDLKIYNSIFPKLELYVTPQSSVLLDNVEIPQGRINVNNLGSFIAKNSRFNINGNFQVRYAGHCTFDNSTFTATRNRLLGGAREINLLSLSWVGSSTQDSPLNKNQLCTVKGCRFRTDETILEEDTINAIRVSKNLYPPEYNNGVILSDSNIDGLFDTGCKFDDFAYLNALNTYVNAKYPFVTRGARTLENITYGPRKV